MWRPINMRNCNHTEEVEEEEDDEEEDRWELARAFAEDAVIRNTTWPPRSYTCSFCRREFRSAQALGGHMNVHRRDRARLHQAQVQTQARPVLDGSISSIDDLSLLNCYWPNGGGSRASTNGIYPFYSYYQLDNYSYNYNSDMNNYSVGNFPPLRRTIDHVTEMPYRGSKDVTVVSNEEEEATTNDELDLELRLGHIPT